MLLYYQSIGMGEAICGLLGIILGIICSQSQSLHILQ